MKKVFLLVFLLIFFAGFSSAAEYEHRISPNIFIPVVTPFTGETDSEYVMNDSYLATTFIADIDSTFNLGAMNFTIPDYDNDTLTNYSFNIIVPSTYNQWFHNDLDICGTGQYDMFCIWNFTSNSWKAFDGGGNWYTLNTANADDVYYLIDNDFISENGSISIVANKEQYSGVGRWIEIAGIYISYNSTISPQTIFTFNNSLKTENLNFDISVANYTRYLKIFRTAEVNFASLWFTGYSYLTSFTSPFLNIGNDSNIDWEISELNTSTKETTSNLSSAINEELNNGKCDCDVCILDENYCYIPFYINSTSDGGLTYNYFEVLYNTHPLMDSITPLNNSYNSGSIIFNTSFIDEISLSNSTLKIYNSSGNEIYRHEENLTGAQNSSSNNYTFITSGNYTWYYDARNENGFSSIDYIFDIREDDPYNYSCSVDVVNCGYNVDGNYTTACGGVATSGMKHFANYTNDESVTSYNLSAFITTGGRNLASWYYLYCYNSTAWDTILTFYDWNGYTSHELEVEIPDGCRLSTIQVAMGQTTSCCSYSLKEFDLNAYYETDTAESEFINNIVIDIDNPNLEILDTSDLGTYYNKDTIYINSSISDANFKNITYFLYNSTSYLSESNYETQITEKTFSSLEPGTYYYNITSCDLANNCNDSETKSVILSPPLVNILEPASGSSYNTWSVLLSYTTSNVSSCWYNLTSGALTSINNELINCTNTTLSFGADAIYTLDMWVVDYLGIITNDSTIFTIEQESGTGGGGGGGTSTIIVGDNKTGWSMTADTGGESYTLVMFPGATRAKELVFANLGEEERNITLTCESEFENFCSYLMFSNSSVALPVIKDVETTLEFLISLPDEIEDGSYSLNIIATDDFGRQVSLTVHVDVGPASPIINIGSKLLTSFQIYGLSIPYFLLFIMLWLFVAMAMFYSVFKPIKAKGGKMWAITGGLFFAFAIIYFI